jgi:uncharacterized protein (DUF924 family)
MPIAVKKILDFFLNYQNWNSVDYLKFFNSSIERLDEPTKDFFEKYLVEAERGKLDYWTECPEGALAFTILTDQIPRLFFQNDSRAYDLDHEALRICLYGLKNKFNKDLNHLQKAFFYMPLFHSEDLVLQFKSIKLYKALLEDSPKKSKPLLQSFYHCSLERFKIIEDFDRYPHRNSILGRASTAAEIEYLNKNDQVIL